MNFSVSEIILILLIALVVVKPEQLPDVAFSLGRFVKGMRKTFSKMKDEVNGIVEAVEKPVKQEVKKIEHEVIEASVVEKANEQ